MFSFMFAFMPAFTFVQKILTNRLIHSALALALLCMFGFTVFCPEQTFAQGITYQELPTLIEGRITAIPKTETQTYPDGIETVLQIIEVELKDGTKITTKVERLSEDSSFPYQVGDAVVVSKMSDAVVEDQYYLNDFVRRPAILLLFGLFLTLVLAVARWNGVSAIVGLVASFLIIFSFILPNIEAGYDPILVAIGGSLFIILISFYLTHGFSSKTTVAVIGTFLALIATGILAHIFSQLTRLTGFATEEVAFLQAVKGSDFSARGLMMAGIIIGTLGVLDDITISQSSIVKELISANPKLGKLQLFTRAMNVGKDHIASLVNTLVLVYTGAALPLLLLFMDSQYQLTQIINFEVVAEEIVRTLVSSIGLVLAVPITTLIAVCWGRLRQEALNDEKDHSHAGHRH
jgi:uncharacterized membrane protein